MCNFLSFWVNVKTGKCISADLIHHEKTPERLREQGVEFNSSDWRQGEWTQDDKGQTLTVRTAPGDERDEKWHKASILGDFPTRQELVLHLIGYQVKNLTTVDARGCTGLTELKAPKAQTVYASGCTGLTELKAPKAQTVYASGCTGLTELKVENATYVYASGCTGLTELKAPKAQTVDASGCTGLTELKVENATYVDARGCTGLTELKAPKAQTVYASGCTKLKR